MKHTILAVMLMASLVSCSEQKSSDSGSNSISSQAPKDSALAANSAGNKLTNPGVLNEPVFHEETIECRRNDTIFTSKGTEIFIPANAFTFQDGSTVTGKVDMKFREYHSAGEIIASNLPMVWDSAGHKIQFESAGMFEIRAYQDGKELKLAQGKKIKIDLASRISGIFSFFSLKEDKSNWTLISQNHREKPSKGKTERLKKLKEEIAGIKKPLPPREQKATDTVFDLDINPHLYPQFADLNGMMWQYAGEDFKNDPMNDPEFLKTSWTAVSLNPIMQNEELVYEIQTQKESKGKILNVKKFIARPVFKGRRLEKETKLYREKLEEYQQRVAMIQAKQKQAEMENAFLRSTELSSLGVFNYDRKYYDENNFSLAASFDFVKKIDLKLFPVRVYLISKQENVVIVYYPETYSKFAFNPLVENKMVALLPENEVACFSAEEFKNINLQSLRRGDAYKFIMKLNKAKGQTAGELDEIITSL